MHIYTMLHRWQSRDCSTTKQTKKKKAALEMRLLKWFYIPTFLLITHVSSTYKSMFPLTELIPWNLGNLMVHQWQHNFALAGCFGSETAERLKKPAQPIVSFFFFIGCSIKAGNWQRQITRTFTLKGWQLHINMISRKTLMTRPQSEVKSV